MTTSCWYYDSANSTNSVHAITDDGQLVYENSPWKPPRSDIENTKSMILRVKDKSIESEALKQYWLLITSNRFTPLTKRPLGNTVPKYRNMKFHHPLVCLCTTSQIYINNYPLWLGRKWIPIVWRMTRSLHIRSNKQHLTLSNSETKWSDSILYILVVL
jgi:hypothetical protein